MSRVLITGIGCVTPLGADAASTWNRLVRGDDAAGLVTIFDVSGCRAQIAAEAALPDLPHLSQKQKTRLSRASCLALPAAREALAQAGLLNRGKSSMARLTVSVSSTGGAMGLGESFLRDSLQQQKRVRDQYFRITRYQAQQQVLDLQQNLGFRGPITILANACASGANAIGHGADLIRAGREECVLVGGYEALTELIYVGFDCLQALSKEKCRPFDKNRTGLMLGEAAAFLVLESEEHAVQRGATALAELAGYGHRTDLHHLTQPHPQGLSLAEAIRQATAAHPEVNIGYVNAHGTGTSLNDASESVAFGAVFGEDREARISSTKAAIGHTLGAAGAIEAVFSVQTLLNRQLPPQINLREPDPLLKQPLATPGDCLSAGQAVLSTNLGFGGSNAALLFLEA